MRATSRLVIDLCTVGGGIVGAIVAALLVLLITHWFPFVPSAPAEGIENFQSTLSWMPFVLVAGGVGGGLLTRRVLTRRVDLSCGK